jgi:phosphopantothenoylcysteine decarboxylase/phosphopantothenate--cysteine ligase
MLSGKRILLIIGGGIAAYKALELVRRLRERGAQVRAILTQAGAEFVTPLSLASLTGDKVFTDLFNLTDEAAIGHIELSRAADLLVVAPATADLMAKMAAGLAGDLATTALLATDKAVLIAPAMNVRMWQHAATQRSLRTLKNDGVSVIGPNEGDMACGEFGPGRMAEPGEIMAAIETLLRGGSDQPLKGTRALVTAGPTHESIDPVRYIANRSSGKQGYAIAAALAELGADTSLVSGPVALGAPPGVARHMVESAQEMLAACEKLLPVDIAVCAAAVADWRVEHLANQKLKKPGGKLSLSLIENQDILATLSRHNTYRPRLVIGFAAETEDLLASAREKLGRKGCDWIVANDVSPGTGVLGGDDTRVHLVTSAGVEHWPEAPKREIAMRLARRIAEHMGATRA